MTPDDAARTRTRHRTGLLHAAGAESPAKIRGSRAWIILGFVAFAAYFSWIVVSIAREPSHGYSSAANLTRATQTALRTKNVSQFEVLFKDDSSVDDDYAKNLFSRLPHGTTDLSARYTDRPSPVLTLTDATSPSTCLAWAVVHDSGRYYLDEVPPARGCIE